MSINRDEQVQCGWCYKTSSLGEWNDLTYSKCTNRDMKRAFTPLTEKRAFLYKSDTFYLCPKCGTWRRGSELRIVKDGGRIEVESLDNTKEKESE